jgi:hypothetical protein
MRTENDVGTYARLSLLSVMLTAVIITVNHWYTLGAGALASGTILVIVPAALWSWWRYSESKAALAGYLLMNLWIVLGFGLFKGLWRSVFRVFLGTLLSSLSTAFPRPTIGTVGVEISGVLTFIASMFVLYYAGQLLRTTYPSIVRANLPGATARQTRTMAISPLLTVMGLAAVFVFTDRDRWVSPTNGVVKIGVIVPTDGPYAILGNSFVKAVEMARRKLPCQADSSIGDFSANEGLGRNVSGGTRPRLS